MKIIHMTDLHLVPEGRRLYGLDPARSLAAAVADINAHHADAAAVVLTGDLAHHGEVSTYRRLRDLLAPLIPPVRLVVGNHDDRAALRDVFPEVAPDPMGYLQSVLTLPEAWLVMLDSRRDDDEHGGVLCRRRLDWLEEVLSRAGRPIYLFLHHPPVKTGIAAMDAIGLEAPNALAAVLDRHPGRVRHIFFGHLHRPVTGTWRGIGFSGLPGLNHQVALETGASGLIRGSLEPPAYGIVLVESQAVAVHLRLFTEAAASPRFVLADRRAAEALDRAVLEALDPAEADPLPHFH